MTITKQAVLDKTHYGTGIYAHILRLYYPNKTVMKIVGRDCGLCRNPFNSNKTTLHIWIEKTDTNNALSAEFAKHEDTQNAIPAGNAFDFAELHYKQNGDELLQTLNREMFLHIGEKRDFYNRRTLVEPQRATAHIQKRRNTASDVLFLQSPNQQHQTAQGGFVARCLQLHCWQLCKRQNRKTSCIWRCQTCPHIQGCKLRLLYLFRHIYQPKR